MGVINGVTRERKDKGDEGINLYFGKLSLALSFIQSFQNNCSSLDLERKKLSLFFLEAFPDDSMTDLSHQFKTIILSVVKVVAEWRRLAPGRCSAGPSLEDGIETIKKDLLANVKQNKSYNVETVSREKGENVVEKFTQT